MRTILVATLLVLFGAPVASAHVCKDGDPEHCEDTPSSQEWRDNYVPLFDAPDRTEDSRTEYQRWRNEHGCHTQFCVWADQSVSVIPADGDPGGEPAPNEVHVGIAGNHSLTEGEHQSEEHHCDEGGSCEGVHDAHGGTIYADVCLTQNQGGGSSVHDPDGCDDGLSDTEFGIVIVEKNPCGGVGRVPVPCADEYHILRPFDDDYNARQREQDMRNAERIAADPGRYVCGNEDATKGQLCS